eukprot:m.35145 g.35145  ORF g.35145 m.35145 type:complete len:567 (+) comp5706_c0_seq1:1697-3397(+)
MMTTMVMTMTMAPPTTTPMMTVGMALRKKLQPRKAGHPHRQALRSPRSPLTCLPPLHALSTLLDPSQIPWRPTPRRPSKCVSSQPLGRLPRPLAAPPSPATCALSHHTPERRRSTYGTTAGMPRSVMAVCEEGLACAHFWSVQYKLEKGVANLPPSPAATGDNLAAVVYAQQHQISRLMDMVEAQSRQISALQSTISRSETTVITKVDGMLAKHFSIQQHNDKTTRDECQRVEKEKHRRLLEAITSSLHKAIGERISSTIREEVSASLAERVSTDIAATIETSVADKVSTGLSTGFNAMNSVIQGFVPNLVSSDPVTSAISTKVSQAMQKSMRESFTQAFQQSLLPALDTSLRSAFAQVDAAFSKGTSEYVEAVTKAQAAVDENAKNMKTLVQRQNEMQRELKALRKSLDDGSIASSGSVPPSPGALPAPSQAPTTQSIVDAALRSKDYSTAFSKALSAADLPLVMRVCRKVEPAQLFGQDPLPLSQATILSLIQQLATRLKEDTTLKLTYLQECVLAVSATDPAIQAFVGPIFGRLTETLSNLVSDPNTTPANAKQAKLVLRLLN